MPGLARLAGERSRSVPARRKDETHAHPRFFFFSQTNIFDIGNHGIERGSNYSCLCLACSTVSKMFLPQTFELVVKLTYPAAFC